MTKKKTVRDLTHSEIKEEVQKAYTKVACRGEDSGSPCCEDATIDQKSTQSSCCGDEKVSPSVHLAKTFGYDVSGLPKSATESFAGCGNPIALASLKEGEVVLDLGSGAGLDAFVASKKVGETGKVIGVDMTPAMLESARKSAEEMGITNVEFRKGDIENLPVEDNSIDVIISNCVINLAPDKAKVFQEAHRVLRSGGRLMVSDIVLQENLPDEITENIEAYTGCLGGAILEDEYIRLIKEAGFTDVKIVSKDTIRYASSVKIQGFKI